MNVTTASPDTLDLATLVVFLRRGRHPSLPLLLLGIEPVSTGVEWIPQNTIELGEEETTAVLELVDRIEQDDDVQSVFHALA